MKVSSTAVINYLISEASVGVSLTVSSSVEDGSSADTSVTSNTSCFTEGSESTGYVFTSFS